LLRCAARLPVSSLSSPRLCARRVRVRGRTRGWRARRRTH
jgi:hypothetical protein